MKKGRIIVLALGLVLGIMVVAVTGATGTLSAFRYE